MSTVASAARRRGRAVAWCAAATVAVVASGLDPSAAGGAASQAWQPFVLVLGLLLVGVVADADGVFRVAGDLLARAAPSTLALYVLASLIVVATTAVLNLDTSVVLLTPVLVAAGRRRGCEDALLYACLFLSNAGSLLLPGSNLTNLIALGHRGVGGTGFVGATWLPTVVAVTVTMAVVGVAEARSLRAPTRDLVTAPRPLSSALGLVATVAVAVLVLVTPESAPWVLAVGVAAVIVRLRTGGLSVRRVRAVADLPALGGLFSLAVAAGTVGRAWSGPSALLGHLGVVPTAAVAMVVSILINNLPAASLLTAHHVARPVALLVGLDVGPNLFVTGSLAWLLWLRAARTAGAAPSVRRACLLGAIAAPSSVLLAAGVLAARGGG